MSLLNFSTQRLFTYISLLFLIWFSVMIVGCSTIKIDSNSVLPPAYKVVDHDNPDVDTALSFGLLGNSNVLISDGENSILIDGFFTRSGPLRSISIGKTPSVKDIKDILSRANVTPKIDAVVVSHSHFDHAMDAPLVAAITDAQLIGSKDIGFIAEGLQKIIKKSKYRLTDEEIITIDDLGGYWPDKSSVFQVRMLPSDHGIPVPKILSKLLGGRITKSIASPKHMFAYKEGIAYTIWIKHIPTEKTFLIQTSSGLNPAAKNLDADVVFLGVANVDGMESYDRKAYYDQFVNKPGDQLVIPVHWENFYRSQKASVKPRPNIFDGLNNTKLFLDERSKMDPSVDVYWLGPEERIIMSTKPVSPDS